MKDKTGLRNRISSAGLKVTPQRLEVLNALCDMGTHPSADQLLEFIRRENPHMGTGTVYNILETFSEKGIVKRVKTEEGILRYDAIEEKHHHIYCTDTDKIEDYYDPELSQFLADYFKRRAIQGFDIKDIDLHIIGKYYNNQKE